MPHGGLPPFLLPGVSRKATILPFGHNFRDTTIVLQIAFVKPWILVPAFWRVCSNPDDLSVAMIILIFFVGGIHFAIGAIAIKLAEKLGITSSSSPSPSKETKDLPTPLVLPVFLLMIAILSGMIMSVYGLFIWISCLIVTLLGFLL